MRTCFFCGDKIDDGNGRIVPLDKPYVNMRTHRETCTGQITQEYLENNTDKIQEYIEKRPTRRITRS